MKQTEERLKAKVHKSICKISSVWLQDRCQKCIWQCAVLQRCRS